MDKLDRINAVAKAMVDGTPVDERDIAFAAKASDLLVRLRANQRYSGALCAHSNGGSRMEDGMFVSGIVRLPVTDEVHTQMGYLSRENKDLWVKLREIFNE